jgi:hypothetical protein
MLSEGLIKCGCGDVKMDGTVVNTNHQIEIIDKTPDYFKPFINFNLNSINHKFIN